MNAPADITTERLELRLIGPEHVDLLVELDSDVEVMRYITGRAGARDEVVAAIAEHAGNRWVAYERATPQRFVGWFGLVPHGDGVEEVGYRLRRDAWGRGLATEGTSAIIAHAFEARGAHRVIAQTMAVNERSRAVMARCGLSFVRTFHLDWDDPLHGTDEGEVECAITRDEWSAGALNRSRPPA